MEPDVEPGAGRSSAHGGTRRAFLLGVGVATAGLAGIGLIDISRGRRDARPTVDDLPSDGFWAAHHGGGVRPFLAPSGTREAYDLALARGAAILDFDCRLTEDGVPISAHDLQVEGMTTASSGVTTDYPLRHYPATDMRDVCGEGWGTQPVLTLAEFLRRYGSEAVLTIEPKDRSDKALTAIADEIKRAGLTRSALMNTDHLPTARSIVSRGLLCHVRNITDAESFQAADAVGAYLAEVNSSHIRDPGIRAAAAVARSVRRTICSPLSMRSRLSSLPAWVGGYYNDAVGYMDRPSDAPTESSIASALRERKIRPGWQSGACHNPAHGTPLARNGVWARHAPLFPPAPSPAGHGLLQSRGALSRSVRFGDLSGPKPSRYTVTTGQVFTDSAADRSRKASFRICAPWEQGDGSDASTQGYVFGIRADGRIVLWTAPRRLGDPVAVLTTVRTPAVTDGRESTLRLAVAPDAISVWRTDVAAAASGALLEAGVEVTRLTVAPLVRPVEAGCRLRLQNGDWMTTTAAAVAGATSIPIRRFRSSSAIEAGAAVHWGSGLLRNTDWRGGDMWSIGSGRDGVGDCLVTAFSFTVDTG